MVILTKTFILTTKPQLYKFLLYSDFLFKQHAKQLQSNLIKLNLSCAYTIDLYSNSIICTTMSKPFYYESTNTRSVKMATSWLNRISEVYNIQNILYYEIRITILTLNVKFFQKQIFNCLDLFKFQLVSKNYSKKKTQTRRQNSISLFFFNKIILFSSCRLLKTQKFILIILKTKLCLVFLI